MRRRSPVCRIGSVLLLSLGLYLLLQAPSVFATRTVRVGVFPAAPLVQNGDTPQGLYIDLIDYFAQSLGWQVEYVDKPWDELLVDLKNGDIDLLPAVAVTEARQSIYDYSKDPPFIDSGVIFTAEDFHLQTVFDLQGARVAGVRGSMFTTAFEAYAKDFGVDCQIVLEDDNPSVMQAISDGTADAGVCIYSLGLELAKKYPVRITAISFSPVALSFAVPKGKNADLIQGIDKLMAPMLKDPGSVYSRSFNKWILPESSASVPVWIWWGLGALCFLGLLVVLWNLLLRRQVAARTKNLVAEIAERQRTEELLRQAQKMEAVGQLAGGIAHDFNNLLCAIIGYADLILSTSEGLPPETLRGHLQQIMQAGERGAALTKQILAFSRRQALRPVVLCLNDVLRDVESLLRRTLREDIELTTSYDPQLGQCEVDPHQFEQVLMNLAVNARDAMPTGGRMVLETANVQLDEDYCQANPDVTPGEYVMLGVSDTGIGMDAGTASRCFEPFFTTKDPESGTGLGLATVYGIVRQSGGSITVSSEPGRGTVFKLYLPRVAKPVSATAPAPSAVSSTQGRETILVVEDEEALRDLIAQILGGLGYEVLTAGRADEALELLREGDKKVDLLLTDVVLPGGQRGDSLAQDMLAVRPELAVIYMSGYTFNAALLAGGLDERIEFLEKPFSLKTLATKVREVLDRVHNRRSN